MIRKIFPSKKRLYLASGLLLALCAGSFFYFYKVSHFGRPSGNVQHVILPTWVVSSSTLQEPFEAPATLRAQNSTEVTASVTALVKRISFQEGQLVDKDEILVELSHGDQSGSLSQAIAKQKEKKEGLEKVKALFEKGQTGREAYDDAIAAHKESEGHVQALREKLKDRLITAPFSGVLGVKRISEGAAVTPGTCLTTLDDLSAMKVSFYLPEQALSRLNVGQAVELIVDSFPQKAFQGVIDLVDTHICPKTRTVEVRAHLDNKEGLLRTGMSARVKLKSAPRQALLVPESAVFSISGQQYVYVMDQKNMIHQRPVQAMLTQPGWMEIAQGLREKDTLVREGVDFLQDRQQITPKTRDVA
jgi:membrane fusion protein (multidrug efflux system)